MRTLNISLVFVPAVLCVSAAVSCGKNSKDENSLAKLPENASKYSQKVVPSDFVNTKSSLSDVASSMRTQASAIKTLGGQLGLNTINSPHEMLNNIAETGIIRNSVRNLFLANNASNTTVPPIAFPPTDTPSTDFPSDTQNGGLGNINIDQSNCDAFFADVDTQIQNVLKEFQSALKQVNEDEALKIKGVSKGTKANNEAFNFNVGINEKNQKAAGILSGGANDDAAFFKAAGTFALSTDSATSNKPSESANKAQKTEAVGSVDLSLFIDGKKPLFRVGGGMSLAGQSGSDPFQVSMASFIETAGGKTPSIVIELQANAEGKLDANTESQKVQANLHAAVRQTAQQTFTFEFKGSGSTAAPKNSQQLSMDLNAEFGAEAGKCVIKSISCTAQPATACDKLNSWRKN